MSVKYKTPPSNRPLRALLRIIERAFEQKSVQALRDAYEIATATPLYGEVDLLEYINGYIERLNENSHYRLVNDDQLEAAKNSLEQDAYGNFDEAMGEMEYTLRSFDRNYGSDRYEVDIFLSKYFSEEDRAIWHKLRSYLDALMNDSNEHPLYQSSDDALIALRQYQQKSYGPLIPTLLATYRNNDSGFSVRLAWYDDCLHVMTHAPIYEQIDDYYINIAPIDGITDFTPQCFPEQFGDYSLGLISQENLFHYEL